MIKQYIHVVIKVADAEKYLTPIELENLGTLSRKVDDGRREDGKPINTYIVCNEDEPYAQAVMEIILRGEMELDG